MTQPALYLITPPALPDRRAFANTLARTLDAAFEAAASVACVQLRLKEADGTPVPDDAVRAAAETVLPVTTSRDVAFLLNDRADLAKAVGADGVHLGQEDGSVAAARMLLGADKDIGVTCHDSRHLAMAAAEAGADYVAFGAFYPTGTKQTHHRPDPEILRAWSMMTTVPCVAIGGITPDNAMPLVAAGADYLAVSSAIWGAEDGPEAAIARFAPILRRDREDA